MARNAKSKRKRAPKTVLKVPDLEQSKSAVLNCLTSPSSQRSYDHAIREFIDWYCSEPRLPFNMTVVTRYRISLEQRQYAPSTINLRLAAVRRLTYEAADCGLLSPDLAAGIRRVKGARRARAACIFPRLKSAYSVLCISASRTPEFNSFPDATIAFLRFEQARILQPISQTTLTKNLHAQDKWHWGWMYRWAIASAKC